MISLCLIINGCSRYSISVNNNQVFTPASPAEETLIQDSALSACVEQTLHDQGVRTPKDLKILNCAYAGILSLDGLSGYSQLTHLSLKQNNISDVNELLKLTHLQSVDLSENPKITCGHVYQLRAAGIKLENSNFVCE